MMNECYETRGKVPPADSGFGSMSNLAAPPLPSGIKSFSDVNGLSDSPVPTSSPYPPSPLRPLSNNIQNVINNNSSSLNSSRNSSPLPNFASNIPPSPIPQSQLPPEGILRPNFSKPIASSPSFSSSQMPNNNQFQNQSAAPPMTSQMPPMSSQSMPFNGQRSAISQFPPSAIPSNMLPQMKPPLSSTSHLFPSQSSPLQTSPAPSYPLSNPNLNLPPQNTNYLQNPISSAPQPLFNSPTPSAMPSMPPRPGPVPSSGFTQPMQTVQFHTLSNSGLPPQPNVQPPTSYPSQPGFAQSIPGQSRLPPQQQQLGLITGSGFPSSVAPSQPVQPMYSSQQLSNVSSPMPTINQSRSIPPMGYNSNLPQPGLQPNMRTVPPSMPPNSSTASSLAQQPSSPFQPKLSQSTTPLSGFNGHQVQSNQLPPQNNGPVMPQRYPPQPGLPPQPNVMPQPGLQPQQSRLPPQPILQNQPGMLSQPGLPPQPGFPPQQGMGYQQRPPQGGLPPQPGVPPLQRSPIASGTTSQPGLPPQPNTASQMRPHQSPVQGQYPQEQYNGSQSVNQSLTQQMGRMSVSNSYNKMWGYETVDIMQCRNVLPEEKVEPPPIRLNNQFAQSANCSPDIFRCTLNKIPETNNLLQKSRLPLGILIHPFKDLTNLPVIQCSTIVRCRACRTYINPFVYFVDSKRWKCNLCYRVNDLPEDFQYDPVTNSYGDPTRRPEIQSATIEFIAPSEYMLRPPQPAAYLFVLDVSAAAAESGYLKVFCDTLAEHIDSLPGDSRTVLAFICFDVAVHFYYLGEGSSRPKEMTVIDIDDIFLPSPEDLLVNLAERKQAILELITSLPTRHGSPAPSSTQSALGAALQAAHKLLAPIGGRVSVFQTCLPNVGPGALTAREDPNNRSSKDVAHLNPATDFYKRLSLECSAVQVAVDFFLLNSQYADLSTMTGISKFSGGSVFHFPLFKASREWQGQDFKNCLVRYFTRKIGFEAVMRIRCTRGLAIHTFHGNFFVRSTDLLSLPNVSPDAGFGMQISIEESLSDPVCFQAGLLYTSSKGERRIRVHTLCLPIATTLSDVMHSADQQCIVGLLAKMAVDRSESSSLSDAREALINAAVDALGVQQLNSGPAAGLVSPMSLRLLPLYLSALLKHPAFRIGTSTRLDDRVAAMCNMKGLPLDNLIRAIYPDLYPVHMLSDYPEQIHSHDEDDVLVVPSPPRLQLSAEKINSNGAYLLDQESIMLLYIGRNTDPQWIQKTLGVDHHSYIGDNWHSIPVLETEENNLLHAFINHLNDDRAYPATIHVITDNSPSRNMFTERLLDDRVESSLSYYEFLQHIKSLMK